MSAINQQQQTDRTDRVLEDVMKFRRDAAEILRNDPNCSHCQAVKDRLNKITNPGAMPNGSLIG